MTFLPIVGRELRVAARRRATYWTRFFTAVAAIVVGLFVYLDSMGEPTQQLGENLFGWISIIAFIYCLFVGVRATADCLSEEKRDGTLGLLFLTDLRGYDVVGGKLVATSLNSFYGLLAIIPMLAIPLLMGGITHGEFWRVALVLVNTFVLSLAAGMFMSAVCTSPRRAMAGTLVFMLVLSVGLPLTQEWIPYVSRSPRLTHVLELLEPETPFRFSDDASFRTNAGKFWHSLGVLHGLCWGFLAAAAFIVPRYWQDNQPGAGARRWRDIWRTWNYGASAERLAFRTRLLDINAYFWLAGRARLKPLQVWIVLTGLACLWTWGAVENGSEWMNGVIFLLTAAVLNTMLKIWITSESGRRLGEDRKHGALELLLSTPLTVADILEGQLLALQRQFFAPFIVVLLVEGVFLIASLRSNQGDVEDRRAMIAFGLAMMILLVADALALVWTAMWISITAPNPNRTTGMTIRRVLVMPFLVTLALYFLLSLVPNQMFIGRTNPVWLFLALYCITGIMTDAWFGFGSRRRLRAECREAATHRFTAAQSFWGRLFRAGRKTSPIAPPAASP